MKKYIALLMVAAFAVTSYAGDKACSAKDKAACAGKDQAACAGKDQAACCAGKAVAKGASCAKGQVAKRVLQSPKAAGAS